MTLVNICMKKTHRSRTMYYNGGKCTQVNYNPVKKMQSGRDHRLYVGGGVVVYRITLEAKKRNMAESRI